METLEQLKAALTAERSKFNSVFLGAPAGFALLRGPQHIFESANKTYLKVVGNRDIIGKPLLEAMPELAEQSYPELMKRVYETGENVHQIEALVQLANSGEGSATPHYFDFSYIQVKDEKGQPYGVAIHTVDVTERVLSKRRFEKAKEDLEHQAFIADQERDKFEAAFQAVAEGIFIFDSNGDPVFMNDSAAKVFGSNSAKDLMERVEYYFERLVLHELDGTFVPLSNWPIARALRGEGFRDWELKAHRTDIDQHWFWSSSGELVKEKGTDRTMGIVVLRDITAKKTAELELHKAKLAAEAANEAKTNFLANISHEIRTPMTAVLGFSEVLREENLSDAERKDALDRITTAGRALLRLIEDVLDISKIEAGKIELQKLEFSPAEIATDVISLMGLSAEQKGIGLKLIVDPSTPKLASSDPSRIRQILINLIGNAVKFTSRGEVRLKVKSDSQKLLSFEVSDTGIGISENDQGKLFQPFAQADASITRSFGGTGLGLSLSRRLAEQLGGKLELVTSKRDAGSCFIATIDAGPFVGAVSEVDETVVAAGPSDIGSVLEGVKVLLAEDVLDNQILMTRYLKKSGAEVVIANNGEEAIAEALKAEFDLILMDVQMPKMDGLQATRKLRSLGYKKPIVALTAHALVEERDRSLQAGCDAHLTKPVTKAVLTEAILKFARPNAS